MNPALAQVTAELMRALQHAKQLYGDGQPSADVPHFRRRQHHMRHQWKTRGHHNYLPASSAEPGVRAAQAALSRRGARYVWGAKGPNRFDCSGLTQWAWRHGGVHLGSDTYTQIRQGFPVPHGQVRAGDLIFPEPGHVMLAINGHECVEAQQSGVPVKVSPMPHVYVARRPA